MSSWVANCNCPHSSQARFWNCFDPVRLSGGQVDHPRTREPHQILYGQQNVGPSLTGTDCNLLKLIGPLVEVNVKAFIDEGEGADATGLQASELLGVGVRRHFDLLGVDSLRQ